MRFSSAAVVAAFPALSIAQENPLDQYKAQVQQILGQLVSYIPNPGRYDAAGAEAAKNGPMKLSVLSLENWKETLFEPVTPETTKPEEWWVLVTGRNKTCFGHCDRIESAFNQTAAKFAELPGTPHMALLNCDDQPILCNSWSAGAGVIWAFDVLPPPAKIDVYKKRLNLTTVTSDDIVKVQEGDRKDFILLESMFHPFHGSVTDLGLSVPFGFVLWAFNLVPQWMFMLVVSLVSRTMMSNRVKQTATPAARGAAPAGNAKK